LKATIIHIILAFAAILSPLNAQQPTRPKLEKPVSIGLPDSIRLREDAALRTLSTLKDTTKSQLDSVGFAAKSVVYSKDSMDAPVDYGGRDSIYFDNKNNLVHLYGQAFVKYRNLDLTANYIVIDIKNSIATAEPYPDSSGTMKGFPHFKDGTQDLDLKKLKYNFKTSKGIAYDVTTKQNDVFVHGGVSKFVSSKGDTTRSGDVVYSTKAIFTTCSADHPHFGIESNKQKLIPNKLIIVGPSRVVIGDVPTPLWLPFAAFPLSKGKSTGLIFPQEYQYSDLWGYGLNNIGWYFPISDNVDAKIQGDIYIRGRFSVNASGNYIRKYKNSGSFLLGYTSNLTEIGDKIIRDPSWKLSWNHTKDQRSNPTFNFGASLNLSFSKSKSNLSYDNVYRNSYQSATSSQLNSNINFTKSFPGRPVTLSGSMSHSQNTVTRDFTMSLPNLDLQVQTLFPFKKKVRIGEEKFYEKIAIQVSSSLRNEIQTKDSLVGTSRMFDNWRFGIQTKVGSNVNVNFLKYFNFSPSISYTNSLYLKQTNLTFDPKNSLYRYDTTYNPRDRKDFKIDSVVTRSGKIDTLNKNGLFPVGQFSMGASLSTRLFGTVQFKNGFVRGFRHSLTPTVGFSYSPSYNRYQDQIQRSVNPVQYEIYNRYQNAVFGAPSNSGVQASLNYGFTNLFELKTFKRRDSTFSKRKIFENLQVSGNYNFAADSFRFSDVSASTGTNLFNGLTSVSLSALYSPYGRQKNGLRSREFAVKENGRFLNFMNANISVQTALSIGQIRDIISGKDLKNPPPKAKDGEESLIDIIAEFRINHQLNINFDNNFGRRDTVIFNNTLSTSGNINLTKKWQFTVGNFGYDFAQKRLTYPDLGFRRDLHCWEMGVNWQPERGTYSFYLRVKPGTLDFLKIPYNRNFGDAQFR
jgi:LptD protein